MSIPEALGLFVSGLFVGLLSGFFGVGGGAFLVPILVRMMGLAWEQAIGLSLTQMIVTSATGSWQRYRQGEVHLSLGLMSIFGSIPGAAMGRALVWFLESRGMVQLAGKEMDLVNLVLTLTFSAMLIYMSIRMMRNNGNPTGKSIEPADLSAPGTNAIPWHEAILVGAVVGFASALLGIGGGFLFVPIAVERFGLPVAMAVGTSLFQMPITAAAGAILYGFNTDIPYLWLIPLLAGSLMGVIPGVTLSRRFNNKQYRFILAIMLLVTAAILLIPGARHR